MAAYSPPLWGLAILVTAWVQIVASTPIGVDIRGDVSLPASRHFSRYVRLSETAQGDVVIDINVPASRPTDAEGRGSQVRVTSPRHWEPVWNLDTTPPQPARVAMTTGMPAPAVLMHAPATVPAVTSLVFAHVTATPLPTSQMTATSIPTSHVTSTPIPTSHVTATPIPTSHVTTASLATSHVTAIVSTTTRKAESPPLSSVTPGNPALVTEEAVTSAAVSASTAPATEPAVKTTTLPPLCSHPLLSKYLTICKTG